MLQKWLGKLAGSVIHQPLERSEEQQREVNRQTRQLSLYHFSSCPYCIRVRRVLERLKLNIELRDIRRDPQHRQALIAGGGRSMVPCLRIEHGDGSVDWMYESLHIQRYLEQRFGR
jgi:glutathione S-transferase